MRRTELKLRPWNSSGVLVVTASLLAWPAVGAAQTVTGQAAGVQATVFSLFGGTTLGLATTGALRGRTDAFGHHQLPAILLPPPSTPKALRPPTTASPARSA